MDRRIGFVGIVVEDMARSAQVNAILSEYGDMITGRIGVPNAARGIGVIGVIVEGNTDRVGALTGRLGNVPGVIVKSALTTKVLEEQKYEKQEG